MPNELVDIEGELIPPFKTEKAYHFYNGRVKVWLPKSLVEWDASSSTMTMPRGIADEKGLT